MKSGDLMNAPRTVSLILVLLVVLTWFAGCSGIVVSQDYTSSQRFPDIKTYAWQSITQEKTGDIRVDSPFIDERIRMAIDRTLTTKGFKKTTESPDFLIAYHYSLSTRISTSPNGPAFGFGFGATNRNSAFGFSTSTDIIQYDEGLLVIDFIDYKSKKPIWRGTSTSRVDTQSKPEKITQLFTAMIEKNLAQFPPKSK
jgi:hypothetical protein